MPANAIAERERRDGKPYSDWIREGYIRVTEGHTVNLDAVREYVLDACKDFNVLRVVHDRAHATNLISKLAFEDGLACEAQNQRGAVFSSAMRHLLDVILQGKIRPAENPVLDWNAQCVVAKANEKEEIHIAKPDRKKDTTRVDGISALVTALTYAMTLQASAPYEAWEQRG
jgi:phage terminase large subunit-like protein